jgi:hypothetical protein
LNYWGIIIDFKVETTRWRLIILRECTSKNLHNLRRKPTKIHQQCKGNKETRLRSLNPEFEELSPP